MSRIIENSSSAVLDMTRTSFLGADEVPEGDSELFLQFLGDGRPSRFYTQAWDIADAFFALRKLDFQGRSYYTGYVSLEMAPEVISDWKGFRDMGCATEMRLQQRIVSCGDIGAYLSEPEAEGFNNGWIRDNTCSADCSHTICPVYFTELYESYLMKPVPNWMKIRIGRIIGVYQGMLPAVHTMDDTTERVTTLLRNSVRRHPLLRLYARMRYGPDPVLADYRNWIDAAMGTGPIPEIYLAQGNGFSTAAANFLGPVSEMAADVGNKAKISTSQAKNWIKIQFDRIIEAIRGLFDQYVPDIAELITNKLIGKFWAYINPIFEAGEVHLARGFYALLGALIALCTLRFLNFLTADLFGTILDGLLGRQTMKVYVAQAAEGNILSLILAAMVGYLGIYGTKEKLKDLTDVLRPLSLVLAVGAVGGCLAKQILILLPPTISAFAMSIVGDGTQLKDFNIDSWMGMASVLNQLSKQPPYLASPYYHTLFEKTYASGMKILSGTLSVDQRTRIMPLWTRMLSLASTISTFQVGESMRTPPFHLHLCGKPGAGKTSNIMPLLRRLYGIDATQVYFRPKNDFWDGYTGQKFIVYDEFLIGSTESESRYFSEILQLVSSARFYTNSASISPSAAGTKGTIAEPLCVITVSNAAYPKLTQMPKDSQTALFRRRNAVLHIATRPGIKTGPGGNVDLTVYSVEELDAQPWCEFRFMENVEISGISYTNIEPCDLPTMLERLETIYENDKAQKAAMSRLTRNEIASTTAVQENIRLLIETAPSYIAKPPTLLELLSAAKSTCMAVGSWTTDTVKDYTAQTRARKKVQPETVRVQDFSGDLSQPGTSKIKYRFNPFETYAMTSAVETSFGDDEEDEQDLDGLRKGNRVGGEIDWSKLDYVEGKSFWEGFSFSSYMFLGMATASALYAAKKLFGLATEDWTPQSSVTEKVSFSSRNSRGSSWGNQPIRGDPYQWNAQKMNPETISLRIGGNRIWATPVGGKRLITYMHGFLGPEGNLYPDGEPMIVYGKKEMATTFKRDKVASYPEADVMMIEIEHPEFPNYSNSLMQSFWSEHSVSTFTQGPIVLTGPTDITSTAERIKGMQSYAYADRRFTLDNPIETRIATQAGDCGRIVKLLTGPNAGLNIGLHVAGCNRSGTGIVTVVTLEMLRRLSTILDDYSPQGFVTGEVSETSGSDDDVVIACHTESAAEKVEKLQALPNCREARVIPFEQRVFVNRSSKIQSSAIAEYLPWSPQKKPAVLMTKDGVDPVLKQITDTLSTEHVRADPGLVNAVYDRMFQNYSRDLVDDFPWRELTFEEACGGVPGLLCSIRIQTSPGWPLVRIRKQKGKRDFVWFEDGELHYTEQFAILVQEFVAKVRAGETVESVYLGYLKDELVSPEKYENKRTRVIYASDVIATVSFRMLYGSVLIKFQNSSGTCPPAIGINQYSHDMDDLHNYLSRVGSTFLAGDYKSFDRRLNPQFRDASYGLLRELLRNVPGFTDQAYDSFVEHETAGEARMGAIGFRPHSLHYSGCFFTTVLNCLVNEGYVRYVFSQLNPGAIFDEFVRLKTMGDDHVVSFDPDFVTFDGPSVKAAMATIGQEYTAADKTPVPYTVSDFTEVTFLGASPRLLYGSYTGAAKKATLQETVCWTRDADLSLPDTANQMIELASQWDEEYFNWYCECVSRALRRAGYKRQSYAYSELSRTVAARRACTGYTYAWVPQVKEEHAPTADSTAVAGLTTFQGAPGHGVTIPGSVDIRNKILNEEPFDMSYVTNTKMFREQFDWSPNDTIGTSLKNYRVPYDLLLLGEENNVQNMPFDRMIYWRGSVELTFQINANPFAQGLICVFFYPLSDDTAIIAQEQWTQNEHLFLSPNSNPSGTIRIPFRFPRQRMNNFTRDNGQPEVLGSVFVGVFNPLINNDNSNVTITTYSSFPDSEFTLPRPLTTADRVLREYKKSDHFQDSVRRYQSKKNPVRGNPPRRNVGVEQTIREDWVVQGQGGSKSSVNNIYNIGDVAGDMPIDNAGHAKGNEQTITSDLKATIPIPADNPPLASGSIPVHATFSGMSTTTGVEPTVALQLAPDAMYREHNKYFNPEETKIEWILGRRAVVELDKKWDTADLEGTELVSFDLDSTLGFGKAANDYDNLEIPASLAIMNMFMFWRADIEIEIMVVKTNYQSGRLRAVVGYGAPSIEGDEVNAFFNQVLDFGGEYDKHKFIIPWNQQTEFLRTYEGSASPDPLQNHSLGQFSVFVANQLVVTSATVSEAVYFNIFVRFINPKVAVPRPLPFLAVSGVAPPVVFAAGEDSPKEWVAQVGIEQTPAGPVEDRDTTEVHAEDVLVEKGVEMTKTTIVEVPPVPCRLQIGEKFEKCVADIHEVARRLILLAQENMRPVESVTLPSGNSAYFQSVSATPHSIFSEFYAAWGGSMRFRTFSDTPDSRFVAYYPFSTVAVGAAVKLAVSSFMGSTQSMAGTSTARINPSAFLVKATEMTYSTSGGTNFLDVQVPFQTHFNFLLTSQTTNNPIESTYTGFMLFQCQSTGKTQSTNDTIYTCVGDDFTFGIWRSPRTVKYTWTSGIPPLTSGAWNVGGWNVTVA